MEKSVKKKELSMFLLGALGQGTIYSCMSGYISDYYTNVLQLSHLFVFALMLLARVWDAINDPLMGIIVDKKTTRYGKMKPYIIVGALPIAVLTFLMYWCPESIAANPARVMVYCAVVYVLWGMIYTMADVPFWSLPNVMTPNAEERSSLFSLGRTFNGVGSALPTVIFAVLGFLMPADNLSASEALSVDKKKYLILALVGSVFGIILYANSAFHVKERLVPPQKERVQGDKGSLNRIFHCKPLMMVILMGVLSSGRYLMQAAATHASRYAFEGEKSATVFTVLQICSAAGMFGAMLFMPVLMKKFEYKKIVIVSCLAGFLASIVTTVVGWSSQSIYLLIPFILLQCIPLGILNVISYAMIGDCLDYMELNTGVRDNALASALAGFVNKLGNALATAGISLMYMYIGLNPADMLSKEGITSASSLLPKQRFGMFSLISIVPGISLLLCTIPVFFYDLTGERKAEVLKQLQAKRESMANAEG